MVMLSGVWHIVLQNYRLAEAEHWLLDVKKWCVVSIALFGCKACGVAVRHLVHNIATENSADKAVLQRCLNVVD